MVEEVQAQEKSVDAGAPYAHYCYSGQWKVYDREGNLVHSQSTAPDKEKGWWQDLFLRYPVTDR